MKNIINMYIYRMVKLFETKISFICVLLTIFIPIIRIKVFMFRESEIYPNVLELIINNLSAGFPCMICCIFLASFFNADLRYGYIKNIITSHNRAVVVVSQMIAAVIFLIVLYLILIVISIPLYMIILNCEFIIDMNNVKQIIVLFWLGISFVCVVYAIHMLAKNVAVPVVLSIISLTGFISIPVFFVNSIISILTNMKKPDISVLLISENIRNICYNDNNLQCFVIGFMYILASFGISFLCISKRDQ